MQYGVFLPNFGTFGDARSMANLARDAENAGWDGFFIWDHVARPLTTNVVDPWVALTAVAMQTSTIRFGTMVTPLPRRRPWVLARQTASLDRLSGGRLIFGAGIGSGRAVEWDHFGEATDPKRRGAMLDEGLDVLAGLWRGEPFHYRGSYYQVDEAQFLPPSTQSPRIPVWIGCNWPNKAPLRRAARWDGVFPVLHAVEEDRDQRVRALADVVAFIRQHRESPFEVATNAEPTPGDDPERAGAIVRRYAEAGATWWLEKIYPPAFGVAWTEAWPHERMRERILQGPPLAHPD